MEIPLQRVKRVFLILAGFTVLSKSTAYLFITALRGRPRLAVSAALVAWLSYLTIHYAETGSIVDPRPQEKRLPDSDSDWVVFGLSSFLFITGMVFASRGITRANVLEAGLGAGISFAGYFVAHHELSEHLV
ncbi:MAG: hypothetical protein ABEI97_01110 [Candidatus Nanohaloarchaea archaeon]